MKTQSMRELIKINKRNSLKNKIKGNLFENSATTTHYKITSTKENT